MAEHPQDEAPESGSEPEQAAPAAVPTAKRPSALRRVGLRLVVLIALLWLCLPYLSATQPVRGGLEGLLARSGYQVGVGSLRISRGLTLEAGDISVAVPGQRQFLTIRSVTARVGLRALLRAGLQDVHVEGPRLYWDRLPDSTAGSSALASLDTARLGTLGVHEALLVLSGKGDSEAEQVGPLAFAIERVYGGHQLRVTLGLLPGADESDGNLRAQLRFDRDAQTVDGRIQGVTRHPLQLLASASGYSKENLADTFGVPEDAGVVRLDAEIDGGGDSALQIAGSVVYEPDDDNAGMELRGRAEVDAEAAVWSLDVAMGRGLPPLHAEGRVAMPESVERPQAATSTAPAAPGAQRAASEWSAVWRNVPAAACLKLWPASPVGLLAGGALDLNVTGATGATGVTGDSEPGADVVVDLHDLVAQDGPLGAHRLGIKNGRLALRVHGDPRLRPLAVEGTFAGAGLQHDEELLLKGLNGTLAAQFLLGGASTSTEEAEQTGGEARVQISVTEGQWSSGQPLADGQPVFVLARLDASRPEVLRMQGEVRVENVGTLEVRALRDQNGGVIVERGDVDVVDIGALPAGWIPDKASAWLSPQNQGRLRGPLSVELRRERSGTEVRDGVAGLLRGGPLAWGGPFPGSARSVSAAFRARDGGLELAGKGFVAEGLDGRLGAVSWSMPDLTVRGSAQWPARWRRQDDGEPVDDRVWLRLALAGKALSFFDPDYTRVGEAIGLTGSVHYTTADTPRYELNWGIAASDGEVLWDRLYADLRRYSLRATGEAEVDGEKVRLRSLEIESPAIGRLSASGTTNLGSGLYDGRVRVQSPSVEEAFGLLVREPLSTTYPWLVGARMTGGVDAAAVLTADGDGKVQLRSRLDLTAVSAAAEAIDFSVEGMHASLPYVLGAVVESTDATGSFDVTRGRLGPVVLDELSTTVRTEDDGLHADQELRLPVAGGTVTIAGLGLHYSPEEGPWLQASVRLEDVDAARLSEEFDWYGGEGKVSGSLSSFRLGASGIQSIGTLEVEVFDGVVRVENPGIRGLFSSVPTWHADLALDSLDLQAITGSLPIGSAGGLVSGTVRNLAVVNGEPTAFQASLETKARRGVAQRISLTALTQLSILGGAGSTGGASAILGFFDEYRYAKMGLHCTLSNDEFRIRGIDQRDGKQFLVIGSLMPPSVNVVSHSNSVSFSEMMRRVRRAVPSAMTEPTTGGSS